MVAYAILLRLQPVSPEEWRIYYLAFIFKRKDDFCKFYKLPPSKESLGLVWQVWYASRISSNRKLKLTLNVQNVPN